MHTDQMSATLLVMQQRERRDLHSIENDSMPDVVASFRAGRLSDDSIMQGCGVAVCTYKRAASLSRFLDSLATQRCRPDQLIIVDASPDAETEQSIRQRPDVENLAGRVLYFRVSDALKGLTRQRNYALRWVRTDLIAFFDDDIVLLDDCLSEMASAHRALGDAVAGVAAVLQNQLKPPRMLWRARRLLGIVSDLQPGKYCRSGMSIPWDFLKPADELIEGDWLPGGATMWKTTAAREVRFDEYFIGYCSGEDLAFSLNVRSKGRLFVAGKARALHLHDGTGRPDAFEMGYSTLQNAYYIHKHYLRNRTWRDAAWFLYAFGLDTVIRFANLIRPGRTREQLEFVKGRARFFTQLLTEQR